MWLLQTGTIREQSCTRRCDSPAMSGLCSTVCIFSARDYNRHGHSRAAQILRCWRWTHGLPIPAVLLDNRSKHFHICRVYGITQVLSCGRSGIGLVKSVPKGTISTPCLILWCQALLVFLVSHLLFQLTFLIIQKVPVYQGSSLFNILAGPSYCDSCPDDRYGRR
jgi:hypothetical protein